MKESEASHVMTIANSIIGVSILAMPYCFKQCGIILSILILILSSILSRLSCHFLLKSAIMVRLKTFEFLAFHAFGSLGKFVIEIGIIGFLMGTCVAFFVVMGDLGPAIISNMSGIIVTDTLRTSILMALALFCVLPLGLLRNVDSLGNVCTATIGFYFCLVIKIMSEATAHIFSGDWIDKVELWRPDGILQCLPIFSMALFCQTQIFEIYQTIPNPTLEKMNNLIRKAVNICTCVYIFVGIFGYIACAEHPFSGNVLMSLTPSIITELMKIGFVLSLAFSFPLIIFPCRASLFSLLYKPTYTLHESSIIYIPEGKFKALTLIIVTLSLITGILIPNIELVLGLVGSTIGVMICVLFPVTCFICLSIKNTNERILAQILLFFGILIMVLGTYANLYAIDEITSTSQNNEMLKLMEENQAVVKYPEAVTNPKPVKNIIDQNNKKHSEEIIHKLPELHEDIVQIEKGNNKLQEKINKIEDDQQNISIKENIQQKQLVDTGNEVKIEDDTKIKEIRHEPPQPVEPVEMPKPVKVEVEPVEIAKPAETKPIENKPNLKEETEADQNIPESIPKANIEIPVIKEPVVNVKEKNLKKEDPIVLDLADAQINKHNAHNQHLVEISPEKTAPKGKKADEVDIEAIRKEETELEQDKQKLADEEKKNDLIKSLEKKNIEQQKLMEEQKKLIEDIKQKQLALEMAKRQELEAVKKIEIIAKQAIESLGDGILKEKETPEKVLKQVSNVQDVLINKPDSVNQDINNKNNNMPGNLEPIPLAKASNYNSVFKNSNSLVNALNVADKTEIPNVVDPENAQRQQLKNSIHKKSAENQVSLFDMLKKNMTNNFDKIQDDDKLIQHREIRSVTNEDFRKEDNINALKKADEEAKPRGAENNAEKSAKGQYCENTVESKPEVPNKESHLIKTINKLSEPEVVDIKIKNFPEGLQQVKPIDADIKHLEYKK